MWVKDYLMMPTRKDRTTTNMAELSILIPSRNEPYLQKTVEDLKSKLEGDTEILVGDDAVEKLGQRALTNKLARQSTAKYLMKIDAHTLFSQGFDVELMKAMDSKTIMAPYLLKLDAENWQPLPQLPSASFAFDPNLVFQYNREVENDLLITETMALQGSAWIVDRQTYWDWNLGDETLGSWGKQGPELGIKAWLNGGTCKVNKNCYYAHKFSEKEEDFPYKRDKEAIRKTSEEMIKRFKHKNIAGLIEKYGYPVGWSPELVANLPK
jgi:hypothetical protein